MSLVISVKQIVDESANPLLGIDESWERVLLSNVAHVLNGFAFKSKLFNNDQGRPLLRIRDVGAAQTETLYDGPYDDRYLVERGDLVIGMDGDFKCAPWTGPKALLNQRVCKITPNTDYYDAAFLAHVLPGYLSAINDHTSSSTVKHLSSRSVQEIPLPLPPLAEQKRIVVKVEELLARVNAARERLAAVPAILKRFRQSVLAAACSGRLTEDWRQENPISGVTVRDASVPGEEDRVALPSIPPTWGWQRTEALCDPDRPITYGVIKLGPPVESGVPTLRSSDVRWLHIDSSGIKTIGKEIADDYSRTYLKGGEVLVTVRGTLGGVAVVPPEMTGFNISREVAMLPVDTSHVADYLALTIACRTSQNWLSSKAKGVAYTGVNIRDLKRLPLAIPPETESQEVVRRVDKLFELADAIETRLTAAVIRAEKLTQSILAKAFRGQLVPTEAELARREGRDYEPASVLLERIKAEREEQAAKKKPAVRKRAGGRKRVAER